MENYEFSDIRLDSKIKRYHYLPYLDYISKDLVDEYNKFILKRRFGFYQDRNNPNSFFEKSQRFINDKDILSNLDQDFNDITNLLNSMYYEFDIAIEKVGYYTRPTYRNYKKMIVDNLNEESIRIYNIKQRFFNYEVDDRSKKYTISHLIKFILILFIFMILSFIFYKRKI